MKFRTGIYEREGDFSLYEVLPYRPKSSHDKEFHLQAKQLVSALDFRSEEFLEKVLPVSHVGVFAVNSAEKHPEYQRVNDLARSVVSMCKELYPDMNGKWFLKREGSIPYNVNSRLSDKGYTTEERKAFSLYCGSDKMEIVCMCYSKEGKTDLHIECGRLLELVSSVAWLPVKLWSTLELPSSTSVFAVLRGVEATRLAFSTRYFVDTDLYLECVTDESVFSKSITPSTPSSEEVVAAAQRRRYSTSVQLERAKACVFSAKQLLDLRMGSAPTLPVVPRYVTRLGSLGVSERLVEGLEDKAAEAFSQNYFKPANWVNLPESIGVGCFPVDSDIAHPDMKTLVGLCESIWNLLQDVMTADQIGKLWYLSRVTLEDPSDAICSAKTKQDAYKYGLYCEGSYLGFVRPCDCYNNLRVSPLERRLAELLYLVSSVPWLDPDMWWGLVLPCSSVIRKNYGNCPVVYGHDELKAIKRLCISQEV